MDLQTLIDNITPDIYENLKRAVELGKWPDKTRLTKQQRELCMQAVIAYDLKFKDESARTGYVPPKKTACDGGTGAIAMSDEPQSIKWKQ
jgi:uncharacterized protein YeaC (DUF1315 family)